MGGLIEEWFDGRMSGAACLLVFVERKAGYER